MNFSVRQSGQSWVVESELGTTSFADSTTAIEAAVRLDGWVSADRIQSIRSRLETAETQIIEPRKRAPILPDRRILGAWSHG